MVAEIEACPGQRCFPAPTARRFFLPLARARCVPRVLSPVTTNAAIDAVLTRPEPP